MKNMLASIIQSLVGAIFPPRIQASEIAQVFIPITAEPVTTPISVEKCGMANTIPKANIEEEDVTNKCLATPLFNLGKKALFIQSFTILAATM